MIQIFRKIVSYSGAQLLIQIANISAGFLLVREMSKTEYAWFAIVLSSMSTISILADSGLGSAFTTIGGKTHDQPGIFAAVAGYIRKQRYLFLLVACLFTLPITANALARVGASFSVVTILCGLIVIYSVPSTDAVVLTTINRLYQKTHNLVFVDILMSCSKLAAFVTFICLLGGITSTTATFCLLAMSLLQILALRIQTRDLLKHPTSLPDHYRNDVLIIVRQVLPMCLFNCVQGQLTTFILTFFSKANEVADLSAMGRFSLLFTFIYVPYNQILMPIVARCQIRSELWRLIIRISIATISFASFVVLCVFVGSDFLLLLLGKQYDNLESELPVFMLVASLGFTSSLIWGLALTRGWVVGGWVVIPLTITLQLVLSNIIDFKQLFQVILFSAISPLSSVIVGVWVLFRGFKAEFGSKKMQLEIQ